MIIGVIWGRGCIPSNYYDRYHLGHRQIKFKRDVSDRLNLNHVTVNLLLFGIHITLYQPKYGKVGKKLKLLYKYYKFFLLYKTLDALPGCVL